MAIYWSKKLYNCYVFFRNLDSNTLVKKSKYYDEEILIYIIADILNQIRKEVGLNSFNNIAYNDMLAFFVNDIGNNPFAKKKGYDAKYRIKMLKLELFFADIVTLVHVLNNAIKLDNYCLEKSSLYYQNPSTSIYKLVQKLVFASIFCKQLQVNVQNVASAFYIKLQKRSYLYYS